MCLTLLSLMALSSMFNTWVRKLKPDSLHSAQGHKHTVLSLVGVRSVLHVGSVINMNDWLNFSSSSGMLFLILIHRCCLHLVKSYFFCFAFFLSFNFFRFSFFLSFSFHFLSCSFPLSFNFLSVLLPFSITFLSFIPVFLFLSFSIDLFCSFPF